MLFRELVVADDTARGLRKGDVLAAVGGKRLLVGSELTGVDGNDALDVPIICNEIDN